MGKGKCNEIRKLELGRRSVYCNRLETDGNISNNIRENELKVTIRK